MPAIVPVILPVIIALGLVTLLPSNNSNNSMPTFTATTTTTANKKRVYLQDGPEAKEIAHHLPYFPFKGIPRFYDIGGFLYEPAIFQRIVDIFADRYREIGIDVVAGYVV